MDACVLKVKLKGIPSDVALNEEATNYIHELISLETQLKCTFDGNPLADGVTLRTETNSAVNEQFKKLLQCSWEKDKIVEGLFLK